MSATLDAGKDAAFNDDFRELTTDDLNAVTGGRTIPNGRTDVIKAMGNARWDDDPSPDRR